MAIALLAVGVSVATPSPVAAGINGQQIHFFDGLGADSNVCVSGNGTSNCWSTPWSDTRFYNWWWWGYVQYHEYDPFWNLIGFNDDTVVRVSPWDWWCFNDANGSGSGSICSS